MEFSHDISGFLIDRGEMDTGLNSVVDPGPETELISVFLELRVSFY